MAGFTSSWPAEAPCSGQVRLRAFEDRDVDMVMGLATDSHVPTIGSLPFRATHREALDYIARQRGRLAEGKGFSFCVADRSDDTALGGIGLWLTAIEQGRTTGGYGVAPSARARRVATQALDALTAFAWTLPPVHRIELYFEPWNLASIRTAETAGFTREGLLRSHQEIAGRRPAAASRAGPRECAAPRSGAMRSAHRAPLRSGAPLRVRTGCSRRRSPRPSRS